MLRPWREEEIPVKWRLLIWQRRRGSASRHRSLGAGALQLEGACVRPGAATRIVAEASRLSCQQEYRSGHLRGDLGRTKTKAKDNPSRFALSLKAVRCLLEAGNSLDESSFAKALGKCPSSGAPALQQASYFDAQWQTYPALAFPKASSCVQSSSQQLPALCAIPSSERARFGNQPHRHTAGSQQL